MVEKTHEFPKEALKLSESEWIISLKGHQENFSFLLEVRQEENFSNGIK